MATHLSAPPRAAYVPHHKNNYPLVVVPLEQVILRGRRTGRSRVALRVKVSDGGDSSSSSYLGMWKNALDRERKEIEFQKIADYSAGINADDDRIVEDLEKKTEEFNKILEVSKEERDRVQRMQVVDRAAAAISAARAILDESGSRSEPGSPRSDANLNSESAGGLVDHQQGTQNGSVSMPRSENSGIGTPGPDFWSWTPPVDSVRSSDDASGLKTVKSSSVFPTPTNPTVEKERSLDFLSIPFERILPESKHNPPLPPLQSLMGVEKVEAPESSLVTPSSKEERELGLQFSAKAAEAAHALHKVDDPSSHGLDPDGSRWWKETGIEQRPDGVICKWTMIRGVSADQVVEWQDKFWEASDEFGHKELGSEKSGRDSTGNVWREYWRESMWQDCGLMHFEKTADKWGKNGKGDEWHEKWWEHYNASGQAEKWAHKWCSIDPVTQLEAGHAHVWHERWGETYDGRGASMKYTDKWAERSEGDGWSKWGDKWDENFDLNGHGVKQGETWWEGKYGERWNRTWGEGHNGSGWVHKYGKSSSGEHWDTHEQQDTWYERYPHFGFYHCFENSVQLREVPKPSESSEMS